MRREELSGSSGLAENDERVTVEALLQTFWNPKVAKLRSWREYLGKI